MTFPFSASISACVSVLASPDALLLPADDVTMETYYYGHHSVLIHLRRRSGYSCSTHFCVDL